MREYGDVQWLSDVIQDPNDTTAIYGERTDRDVVMDSVLTDLDYAIANIGSSSDKTAWSSNMARAMKSDICLYEGTYCKYRTLADNGKAPDASRAQRFLQESVKASEELINSGKYSLTTNYGEIYNSLDLTSNREIIFFRNYEQDIVMHGLVDYTCGSTEIRGITKDAFDAFLFRDGKPRATTTLDTDDKGTLNANGNLSISKQLSVRDKRLSVLTDSIVYIGGHGWCRPNDAGYKGEMTSSTGYGVRKFDNTSLDTYYRTNTNTGYTDAPIYWYAVILLNEAEAKAEPRHHHAGRPRQDRQPGAGSCRTAQHDAQPRGRPRQQHGREQPHLGDTPLPPLRTHDRQLVPLLGSRALASGSTRLDGNTNVNINRGANLTNMPKP